MSYDLTPMKAPRTAGMSLRVLTSMVENPMTGALLAGKLLRDAGVLALRDAAAQEPHCVTPPLPRTAPPDALEAREGPAIDLEAVADGSATEALNSGFAFETAADFRRAYAAGQTTPTEVAERVLTWTAETEKMDPAMRIFIAQDRADVLAQASASTARIEAGAPLGPLDGVPVAVKDELDQIPYPTTVGTTFLAQGPAREDASVVARLRAQGAILIGKTNMHEMGMGVTGLNPHHGACRNPYDAGHATGGSSSGPAAAVAAGLCPIAVGADGGGSIRIPAALCGVVGLKATFGRVSEHGAAPLCWSVAHVGPIAATVDDAAIGYAIMAGRCDRDTNSLTQPLPTLEHYLNADLKGQRIGIYRPWFEDAEADVVARCREAVEALTAAGAEVVDIEVPELGLLRSVHLVTIVSEMAAAHVLHYAKHRKAYGCDVRLNLCLARRLTAYDYVHAQRHRARLCAHFDRVLESVDAICTPTTGRTAPALPADALASGESNLPVADQIMRFAPAANLTGLPAISVPAGYDAAGLPVGLQLMGRAWSESTLLRMARVVEAGIERRTPKVHRRLLDV